MSWARIPLGIVLFVAALGNGLASLFLAFVVLMGGYAMAWLLVILVALLVAEIIVGVRLLRNPKPNLLWVALGLVVLNAAGWYLLSGNSIGPIKAWSDSA